METWFCGVDVKMLLVLTEISPLSLMYVHISDESLPSDGQTLSSVFANSGTSS